MDQVVVCGGVLQVLDVWAHCVHVCLAFLKLVGRAHRHEPVAVAVAVALQRSHVGVTLCILGMLLFSDRAVAYCCVVWVVV